MTVRTLFIGLDGATFTVLDDLTRPSEGGPVMPFLARIFAGGSRAKLRSTPNPLTPPAWVSLMTGRGPGHHGVFDFIRAEERGGDVRPARRGEGDGTERLRVPVAVGV